MVNFMIEFSHQTCGDADPRGRPRTPRGAGQAGPRLVLCSGCPGPGDGCVSGQTEPHVRIYRGTALSQTLSGGAQLLEGSGVTAWAPRRANGHCGGWDFVTPRGSRPETWKQPELVGTCSQNPLREGACRFHGQQRGSSRPARSGPAPAGSGPAHPGWAPPARRPR